MTDAGDLPLAPTSGPPALELRDVASGYGSTTILRDVSITVPAGEATALLGPNGAGKTTLLRTVSGLLPASKGSITLFADDVTRVSPHRRAERGLCHIPEGRGIFRSLSVRENLVMQSKRGDERDAVERAVDAFPILGERLNQAAGTLSGGQQQMLAIAAAYTRQPRLILVDEASLGLAPVVVDEIFRFLADVTARGTALLLVDQFVSRALALATTAYILRKGHVAYSGTATGLLDGDVFRQYVGD